MSIRKATVRRSRNRNEKHTRAAKNLTTSPNHKTREELRNSGLYSGETLVDATLTERGSTHGLFVTNAYVSQSLKKFIREQPGWQELGFDMKEAIDMQCLKLSRILSGKCATKDHWVDIAGYAMLVADELDD